MLASQKSLELDEKWNFGV